MKALISLRVFSVLIGFHVYPLNVLFHLFLVAKRTKFAQAVLPSLSKRHGQGVLPKGQVSRGTANKQGLGMFDLITIYRQRHELSFIFNTHDSCK